VATGEDIHKDERPQEPSGIFPPCRFTVLTRMPSGPSSTVVARASAATPPSVAE
jgi:hypothetical protein